MKIASIALLVVLVGCGQAPPPPHFTIAYGSDPRQVMDVYRPDGATVSVPTVVFLHGGGFRQGSRTEGEKYARHLCAKGLAVVSVDYRLSSSGATWPAPLDDARAALRYVRANARALGASKTGVMGASAGACLAELLALEEDPVDGGRPECLVALSGYGDLGVPSDETFADFDAIAGALFGHAAPFSESELRALSPARLARRDVRALVAHSNRDSNVFVTQGDVLAAALTRTGANPIYLRRDGWAHGDDLWLQDGGVRAATAAFLLASLR